VMRIGGQRERAELLIAVEQLASGAQAAEQAGQARDQIGVAAGLVLPPGIVRSDGQGPDIRRGFQCRGCASGRGGLPGG
jgi:hypothetical protein